MECMRLQCIHLMKWGVFGINFWEFFWMSGKHVTITNAFRISWARTLSLSPSLCKCKCLCVWYMKCICYGCNNFVRALCRHRLGPGSAFVELRWWSHHSVLPSVELTIPCHNTIIQINACTQLRPFMGRRSRHGKCRDEHTVQRCS